MTINAYRPYCRHPKCSAMLNFVLCLGLIAVAVFLTLPTPIYWLAAIFGACGILFSILAVTNPGTTISIDDTKITRSGGLSGSSLRYTEIASVTVERDLDAQNYKQIIIRSHVGGSLLIDPRFLNPDIDGLVDALRSRLRQHGIEIDAKHTTAEQGSDGKPDTVAS